MNVSSTCPSAVCRQGVGCKWKGRAHALTLAQTNPIGVKCHATASGCSPPCLQLKSTFGCWGLHLKWKTIPVEKYVKNLHGGEQLLSRPNRGAPSARFTAAVVCKKGYRISVGSNLHLRYAFPGSRVPWTDSSPFWYHL